MALQLQTVEARRGRADEPGHTGHAGSPIHDLHVDIDSGSLIQTGTLHTVIDIKFRMRANVSLTPDGRIRVHLTHMTDQKLLRTIGLDMSDLIDVRHARGLTIDKDDVILDALSLLPPPVIDGRLVDVHVDGQQLIERFAGDSARVDTTQSGYLHFRGGRLQPAVGGGILTNHPNGRADRVSRALRFIACRALMPQ